MTPMNPDDYIVTRKRKKYKFALFYNSPLCLEFEQWPKGEMIDVLEMGAGTGLFSVALARANLADRHMAVDVKADRLQTGARKAEEEALGNIRFLRARADQLADRITPSSLTSIWITFPDPFPKSRSAKHRLTHSTFLAMYSQWLKPSGALYFKTDAHDLFDWSLEQLVRQGWQLRELSFDLHESDIPDVYKTLTTYETRYRKEGRKICFVKALPPTSVHDTWAPPPLTDNEGLPEDSQTNH